MALEDAACMGIVFSEKYWQGDIQKGLQLYETTRKPRATKVQEAAARARENIHERIGGAASEPCAFEQMQGADNISGFSSNTDNNLYSVKDENKKLTIEEMNSYDMYKDIEGKLGLGPDNQGLLS